MFKSRIREVQVFSSIHYLKLRLCSKNYLDFFLKKQTYESRNEYRIVVIKQSQICLVFIFQRICQLEHQDYKGEIKDSKILLQIIPSEIK